MSTDRTIRILLLALALALAVFNSQAQTTEVPVDAPQWTQVYETADGSPISVGDTLVLQGFPLSGDVYSEGMINLVALRKDRYTEESFPDMDIRLTLVAEVRKNPDYLNYSATANYDSLMILTLEVGKRDGTEVVNGLTEELDVKPDDSNIERDVNKIMAVIDRIEVNTGDGYEDVTVLPENVYLELTVEWRGLRALNLSAPGFNTPVIRGCAQATTPLSEISWSPVAGATEYHLEWTYVDDYRTDDPSNVYLPPQLRYDLDRNATRVVTTKTNHALQLLFDQGYVALRVRAVGRDPNDPSLIVYGPWSPTPASGPLNLVPANARLHIAALAGHQSSKNWQITCSYAEDGKHKEVMVYADGTTRSRQTATWSSTLQLPIIKEDFYDAVGRTAVEVMPVPMIFNICDALSDGSNWAPIDYYQEFNEAYDNNQGRHIFTYEDLEPDGPDCALQVTKLDPNTGAEYYYNPLSVGNSSNAIEQSKFIPRADGHPYVQTEYMPDQTGRVKRKGGVGEDHQLNGHATRYIYGPADQVKLDRLFGSEAPYASQCQRNVTIDPNGQASATYLDGSGRTLATALIGAPHNGLEALNSWTGGAVLQEDLFGGQTSALSDRNHFDPVEGSFTFDQPIVVPMDDALLRFDYGLTVPSFEDECLQNICYHCVYELEISLTDAECGNLIYPSDPANISQVLGYFNSVAGTVYFDACTNEPQPDPIQFGTCDQDLPTPNLTANCFTTALNAGTYILHKKLKIHDGAMQQYAADYVSGAHLDPDCFESEQEIDAQVQAGISVDDCHMTCEACASALGTLTDYLLNNLGTAAQWQALYEECTAPCKQESWCTVAYQNMQSDMRPGGQYASYSITGTVVNVQDFTSILQPSVQQSIFRIRTQQNLPLPFSQSEPAWRQPRLYTDADPDLPIAGYFEEDGTEAVVYLADLGGGTFYPDVLQPSSNVFEESPGVYFTRPQHLVNLYDFLMQYISHPAWARSLVYLHPEYCYYRECKVYGEIPPGQTMSSDEWDAMLRTATYNAGGYTNDAGKAWVSIDPTMTRIAQRTALMPPQLPSIQTCVGEPAYVRFPTVQSPATDWKPWDPYLSDPEGGQELAYSYLHYKAFADLNVLPGNECDEYLSMPEFAAVLARCGGVVSGTLDPSCRLFGSGSDADILEKEWNILKALYLGEKYRIQKRWADQHLSNSSGACTWCTGVNHCIGEEDNLGWQQTLRHYPQYQAYNQTPTQLPLFGPGPLASIAPFNQPGCQPCGGWTWSMYQQLSHKARRVAEPVPAEEAMDQDLMDQLSYLQSGQCPVSNVWQGILGQFIHNPSWNWRTSTLDLDANVSTYQAMHLHVDGLQTAQAQWTATTAANGTVTAAITIGTWSCTMTLDPPDNVAWTDLQDLIDLSALNANQFFTLVATALVNNELVVVNIAGHLDCPATPDSPFNLYSCHFPPACNANAIGEDMEAMMNAMALGYTNTVNSAVLPVGLPAVLDPFQDYQCSCQPLLRYSWNPTSLILTITDQQSYVNCGIGCPAPTHPRYLKLQFTSAVAPLTLSASLLNSASFFVDLRSAGANTFEVDLVNSDQVFMGTVLGEATWYDDFSNAHPRSLGSCQTPIVPACSDAPHALDDALVAVIKERLLFNGNSNWVVAHGEFDLFDSPEMNSNLTLALGPLVCPTCLDQDPPLPYQSTGVCTGPVASTYTITFPTNDPVCNITVSIHFATLSATQFDDLIDLTLDAVNNTVTGTLVNGSTLVASLTINANCLDLINCEPCSPIVSNYPAEIFPDSIPSYPDECLDSWMAWHNWAPQYNASQHAICRGFILDYADATYEEFIALGLCACVEEYFDYTVLIDYPVPGLLCGDGPSDPPRQLIDLTGLLNPPPTQCGNGLELSDPCVQAYVTYLTAVNDLIAVVPLPALVAMTPTFDVLTIGEFIAGGYCTCGASYASALSAALVTGPTGSYLDAQQYAQFGLATPALFCQSTAPCEQPIVLPPTIALPPDDPCVEGLLANAALTTQLLWQQEQDRLLNEFNAAYHEQCLTAIETFSKRFKDGEHHYTLYYYDQAGNLIRTVPPEGVNELNVGDPSDPTSMANMAIIAADRLNGSRTVFTDHALSSEYTFNTLNNPTRQWMPDQDPMKVWEAGLPAGLPTDLIVRSVQFTGGGTGYLAGQRTYGIFNRGYVFRTGDAGNTWQRTTGLLAATLHNSFFPNATNGYAVGDHGTLLWSQDAGSSWDLRPVETFGMDAHLQDLHFSASNTGWVAGRKNAGGALLRRTVNSGSTFGTQPTLFNSTYGGISALTGWGTNLITVGGELGQASGLWASTVNDGSTWQSPVSLPMLSGGTAADLNCATSVGNSDVWAGGSFGTLIHHANTQTIGNLNANAWRTVATHTTDDILDLWFLDNSNGIALFELPPPGSARELRYTNDGGVHWTTFCTDGHLNALYGFANNGTQGQLIAVGNGGQWMQVLMQAGNPAGFIPFDPIDATVNLISAGGHFDIGSGKLALILGGDNGMTHRSTDALALAPVFTSYAAFYSQPTSRIVTYRRPAPSNQLNVLLLNSTAGAGIGNFRTVAYDLALGTWNPNSVTAATTTNQFSAASLLANGQVLLFSKANATTANLDISTAIPASAVTSMTATVQQGGAPPTIAVVKAMTTTTSAKNSAVMVGPAVSQQSTVLATNFICERLTATTGKWSRHTTSVRPLPLNDLADGLSGTVIACGDQGTFFERAVPSATDPVWRAIPTRSTGDLHGVAYHPGTAKVIGVGNDGLCIVGSLSAPNGILPVGVPSALRLNDVLVSGDRLTIAGDDGALFFSANFTNLTANPLVLAPFNGGDVLGLATTPTTNQVCAVGERALLHKAIGTARLPVIDLFPPAMHDVSFNPAGEGYAAGSGRTLRHTLDGGLTWDLVPVLEPTYTAVNLRAVCLDGSGKALVGGQATGGNNYYLRRITGNTIAAPTVDVPALASNDVVNDIAISAGATALVVGTNGTNAFYKQRKGTDLSWSGIAIAARQLYAIHAWPRYYDLASGHYHDEFAVAGNGGRVLRFDFDVAIGWAPPSGLNTDLTGGLGGVFRAVWFHDRVNGLAVASSGALYRLRSTLAPNSTITMESSNSGYHGSLSGQTGPNIQTYTMAFSDRTHGFLGGFYAVGAPGFARTVLDDAGLQSQRMWYDRLGRLVFSQNTKQQLAGNYSYSTYDALGRVAEAGQVSASTAYPFSMVLGANVHGAFNPTVINDANAVNFLYYNLRTEVLTTHYDQSIPGNTVPFTQENLRLRVATVTYQDAMDNNAGTPTVDGDPLTFEHATHYSYDIHGNVKHLAQDIPQLNLAAGLPNPYTGPHRYKELHYTFDLISGNVNEVTYQPGMLEQWIHKYTYDADNRLSQASFTSNNADIELGANYLYYPHGPLRRLELGHKGIQGLDYAYTLQGWIKGLNSDILTLTNDMGGDSRAGSLNATFPRDVFGYSLHYNLNDYKAIDPDWGNSTVTDFLAKSGGDIDDPNTNLHELYNGNIASWSQTLPNTNLWGPNSANEIGNNLRFVYQYDQLNRLLVARASDKMNAGNDWSAITANLPTQLYKSSYGYDANGNILNAERWDQFQTRYDQFEYNYLTSGGKRRSNRLYRVKDQMPANVVDPSDPADQGVADIDDNGLLFNNDPVTINNGSNNYRYDPLGNLNQDKREQIAQIDWTVAGKVKSVTRTAGSTLAALTFGYGAHGHRIWKKNLQTGNTTFYIHDAQGNLMATYEAKPAVNSLALSERPIYGSDRLGMDMNKIELYGLPDIRFTNLPTNGPAGLRRYEIKDHLGNVCVTTTGDRYGIDQTPPDGTIDYTMPKVVSWSGYEPFGSLLPGRQFNAGNYRFAFNGMEKDDEVNGSTGTSYDFGARIYDSRVGKWLSLDPLMTDYPSISPYTFVANSPLIFVDPDGRIIRIYVAGQFYDYTPGILPSNAPAEVKKVHDAVMYNMHTGKGKEVWTNLHTMVQVIEIRPQDDVESKFDSQRMGERTSDGKELLGVLKWDFNSSLEVMEESREGEGLGFVKGYLMPSTVIIHEVGHALEALRVLMTRNEDEINKWKARNHNEFGGDEQYDTEEERRNIIDLEQIYIRQINSWEQTNNPDSPTYQPVRFNHKAGPNIPFRKYNVNEIPDKSTYPEWRQMKLKEGKSVEDGIK